MANEDEVLAGLAAIAVPGVSVTVAAVDLAHLGFEDQLQTIVDTDVLVREGLVHTTLLQCPHVPWQCRHFTPLLLIVCQIGMHGAGLTHVVFLPPWASVVELWPNVREPLQLYRASPAPPPPTSNSVSASPHPASFVWRACA
jgi:hypothetical protein